MNPDRIFVEWYRLDDPGWGGYVTSLDSDFQGSLEEMVALYGPPTKVEFRAEGTGTHDGTKWD